MKQRVMIAAGLAAAGLLGGLLGGCQSSQSSVSPEEAKSFKGTAPPAGMAQAMQAAQQNWQKLHPGAVTTAPGAPGATPAAGTPGKPK